jgi:ABC-2 type transport system ATP-binding protein
MNAVETEHLSKSYGKIRALENLSLRVPRGSIYGLVGPNGAGKTTLIKILVGATRPTKGSVTVLGFDPIRDKWKLRRRIGYMPQAPALYDDLSARDNIRFFGKAQSVSDLEEKTEEILSFAELTQRADDHVNTFSGGMKKRVSLCCALIHHPDILFLDEPTAAIDPHLKIQCWILMRKLAARGVTLLVSTHLMDEALLCDQVAVLQNGEIIALDAPQKILERGTTRLKISTGNQEISAILPSTPRHLAFELKKFGLREDITAVELRSDNLEEIIMALMRETEKGRPR